MNLRQIRDTMNKAEWYDLAVRAGTTGFYLNNVLYKNCGKHAGVKLCKRLVAADPRLTLAELRPDIWGDE